MNGWIEQRRGAYYAVIDFGVDPLTMKRNRQWQKAGTTKRDAQRLLAELLDAHETNTYLEPDRISVGDYLTVEWLPSIRNEIRHSTYDSYRRTVEIHVVPRIGRARLQSLRPIDLTRFYSDLLDSGRRDGRGGLSAKTVRNIHLMLRKAFDDALGLLFLRSNPALGSKPPKSSRATGSAVRYWTADELRRFLDENRDHRHWELWYLAANTGMRRGELVGLRWSDVHLDTARLAIRTTILSVGYEITVSDPKTARGSRTIDLDPRTVRVLRNHRAAQDEHMRQLGAVHQDHDLVFSRPDGSPHHPDLITQAFDRRVARTNVARIRLHDLRHTHATLLLMAGVPPKVVSERLGHASIAFTMDIYAHVIPGMQATAAATFADEVFGPHETAAEDDDSSDATDTVEDDE